MDNCTKSSGAIAGKPWTFSNVQNLRNLYNFGSLLLEYTKDIYEPLDRWSNVSLCTEKKGTTTYRYGVLNDDRTWSLLNKVDNHLFVFAYILNKFKELDIDVVKDNLIDMDILSVGMETGQYSDNEGNTVGVPTKEDFFSEDGMYYNDIICMIYGTTKKGDETENKAMEYLQSIATRSGEWEGMCPGDTTDVKKGIDIIQVLDDGKTQGFQVKPFDGICFDHNNFIVSGVGNAKIYRQPPNGPDYYIFGGQGKFSNSFIIFKNYDVRNTTSKNRWGKSVKAYTFPKSSIIKHTINGIEKMVCGQNNSNSNELNEWYIFKNKDLI
jgi:hypothetical protein